MRMNELTNPSKKMLLENLENGGFFGYLKPPWHESLVNFSVPCLTPTSLLASVGMPIEAVDVLILEPPDSAAILESFLALENFAPAALRLHLLWGWPKNAEI